jgi:type IX secretion system PorP/SprF family membrane protein
MKKLLFISALLFGLSGIGQQQMVTTNFLMNDYYYNPAIAGSKDKHIANLAYRNQWTGFEGAPATLMGNFYGSYKNERKIGYGVSLVSDRAGLTQNTGFYLNYAHHFKLNDKLRLGLGVKPGYMQYRVKLYDAQLADEGDEVLTGNVLSANAFDVHSGFHLYSERFFIMGSIQHLLGKSIQFTSYNANLAKHYTFIGGYNYEIKEKGIVLQPSVMFNFVDPVPMQWTAMMKATFKGKWWAGITYRSQDAAGINVGYRIKDRIAIGYGFDYSLSGIQQYQSGSHEIVISFVTTPNRPTLDDEDEELNKSIMEDMKDKLKGN